MFHSTIEDRSQVIPKEQTDTYRVEDVTTLNILWLGGDLSCAPDPNSFDYLHRPNININLNLGVINLTTVGNMKSEPYVLVQTTKCILVPQYSTSEYITDPRSMFNI